MATIKIPDGKAAAFEDWCKKNISPLEFWIHNKRGGRGWTIEKNNVLKVHDEKKAMLLILGCL